MRSKPLFLVIIVLSCSILLIDVHYIILLVYLSCLTLLYIYLPNFQFGSQLFIRPSIYLSIFLSTHFIQYHPVQRDQEVLPQPAEGRLWDLPPGDKGQCWGRLRCVVFLCVRVCFRVSVFYCSCSLDIKYKCQALCVANNYIHLNHYLLCLSIYLSIYLSCLSI